MPEKITKLFASSSPSGEFHWSDFWKTVKVGAASVGLLTLTEVLTYFSAHVGDFATGSVAVIVGGALSMIVDALHRYQTGNKIGQ